MDVFGTNNPGYELFQFTDAEALILSGIAELGDPNADRILFWDDSAGSYAYLTVGSGLSITGTTLSASGSATLADGDYGDITVSSSGTVFTIDNGVVSLAKTSAGVQASLALADSALQSGDNISTLTNDSGYYAAGGTDVALADGGTGASLTDPGANTLMGWDDTDGAVKFFTIGSGLSYDHATHTLSASASAPAWGDITGTLSNQTDLQTALDAKVESLADLSVTATAAELNILDGATLTVTELNYVDGVTSAIQTQLDAKQPLDADLTSWAAITRASGFDTFVATPSSANLKTLITDETGSGSLVFATSPTLVTPILGTPTSGTLTNCTGLPIAGLVASTSTAIGVGTIELGHASDTTISRSSAGVIAVEGVVIPSISSTNTFTNKRITQRVSSNTSSTTPTPDADSYDVYLLTALAAGATFGAPTGTPTDGQKLIIRIKDNGTARSLAFNAIYRASSDLALPTTTVVSKTIYLGFMYNSADTKWDLIAKLDNF